MKNWKIILFSFLSFTILGVLFIYKFPTMNFKLSGYDCVLPLHFHTPIEAIHGTIRHPFLSILLAPFNLLYNIFDNDWFIVIFLSSLATISFLYMYKILREIIELTPAESILYSIFLFSFGHILLMAVLPETYPISLCLLLISVYYTGSFLKNKDKYKLYKILILFMLTAGTTTTNGIKILISILFAKIPIKKRILHIFLAGGLFAVSGSAVYLVSNKIKAHYATAANIEKTTKDNSNTLTPQSFQFIDNETPLIKSIIENFSGEAILFHDAKFKDVYHGRNVIEKYTSISDYIVIYSIIFIFVVSAIINRKNKFVQYLLSCWCVDIFIHLICRFGLNECYIFSSHWLYIIPIVIAVLAKRTRGYAHHFLNTYIVLATLFIGYNNLSKLIHYLLS